MASNAEEWMRQARHDMGTADYLLKGRRYTFAVFTCHLSLEKALKGLYQKSRQEAPPKLHNLFYFIEALKLTLPEDLHRALERLNRLSLVSRYPEDIRRMQRELEVQGARQLLRKGREALRWFAEKFREL